MTEAEIKEFFLIKDTHKNYKELREKFSQEEIENDPATFITEILKQTYGFPISFMDEGSEELFEASPEQSQEVYEKYAMEILNGEYEDLYDFTQEISAEFSNFKVN